MSVALNEVHREAFTHKKKDYEALFYTDADEPFVISFEILCGGLRVPLSVAGLGRKVVRFSVPFETQFDARITAGQSAIAMLFNEARRMVEETY